MIEFKKYPSIGRFKDVLKDVNKKCKGKFSHLDIADDGTKTPVFKTAELPVLTFRGTVKLHGTNAAVAFDENGQMYAQSRTRILSLTADNHGFYAWAIGKKDVLFNAYKHLYEKYNAENIYIYGEFCGGNIQGNVALMGIEKTFVVFGILVVSGGVDKWLSADDVGAFSDKSHNIHNVFEFETYCIDIDMSDPNSSANEIDAIRDAVDAVCPVGKALCSVSEITFGEGVVWRCMTEPFNTLAFKHKGENHKRSGKMPKSQKIKVVMSDEQTELFKKYIDTVLTVDRLAQGLEYLTENSLEIDRKNTGVYLKWIGEDIRKEHSDEIEEVVSAGIQFGELAKCVASMSKEFFFDKIDEL